MLKGSNKEIIISLTKAVKRTNDMEERDYTLTPVQ